MKIQAIEHSLIAGVLQVLAICSHCHHSPSPRMGDQPYRAWRPMASSGDT